MRTAGYTTGHSNGAIAFNPTANHGNADYGNLHIGSGDGEYWDPGANAQNGELPQGKILRMNALQGPHGEAYTILSDNPYVNVPGQLPEIPANDAGFGYTYPKCGNSLGSGILYRGAGIPELDGKYVMTGIVNGRLFYCDPAQAGDGLAAMSEIQVEQAGFAAAAGPGAGRARVGPPPAA